MVLAHRSWKVRGLAASRYTCVEELWRALPAASLESPSHVLGAWDRRRSSSWAGESAYLPFALLVVIVQLVLMLVKLLCRLLQAKVDFQFRDIRAKAATHTGDLAHSQRLLGHKDRDMSERYVPPALELASSRVGRECVLPRKAPRRVLVQTQQKLMSDCPDARVLRRGQPCRNLVLPQ